MQVLIFDPVGGASGDMILGSLIHLGCPLEALTRCYDRLGLGPFTIRTGIREVQGISTFDLHFDIDEEHHHRTYRDIRALIADAALDETTTRRALQIFEVLARAEAAVHGVAPEEVHFHEVGSADSILDVVGIAAALTQLGVEAVYARPVPLGGGMTRCQHGRLPLPSPATLEILKDTPVRFTHQACELTTPTGAAVIKALATPGPPPGELVIKGVGYGCGDREIGEWLNLFRCLLAQTPPLKGETGVMMIEADVDDMNPEEWEAVREELTRLGALDISLTQRIMKHGRPGVGLKVIADRRDPEALMEALLMHTTSIGVRSYPVERRVLSRREFTLQTPYGPVGVKEVVLPDGKRRCKLEYRDLHRIAAREGLPVLRLRQEIEARLGQGRNANDDPSAE